MNGADKRLIDAWRKIATPTNWKTARLDVARSELIDLLAAFDRALADTPTLVRVDGVMWCVEHDDMAYEGNDCAAAFHDREPEGTEGEPCDLRPLGYVS